MNVTVFVVILIIFVLFVLAVGKAVTMWITGMDIAVKQQKTMIENQKEIIALLGEIADNGKPQPQRRVEPPVVRQS